MGGVNWMVLGDSLRCIVLGWLKYIGEGIISWCGGGYGVVVIIWLL